MKGSNSSIQLGKNAGFTLLELMVTIVIVIILASIALPSYRSYTLSAHRSEAIDVLVSSAQRLERQFTETNSYVGVAIPESSTNGYYTITSAITAATYTLTATATGKQADDTTCSTFSINHKGEKSSTTAGVCW